MKHAIILLAAISGLTTVPTAALACGISTHQEVCHRAAWWFDASAHPEYYEAIQANPEALQGGASFPDWGYVLPDYGDAAEEAHWDPFIQAAADYIHRTYPQPWDEDTLKLTVFMFALTAHSVADISWHGLGISEGMIDMMSEQDFDGDWGAAHSAADTGGDMVTAYEIDQAYMTAPWYVPVADMVAIYHELGYEEVTPQSIMLGNFLIFLGGHAERLAGQLLYPYTAADSPAMVQQMQDYFVGGLDDMAIFSAWKWLELIDWMENGSADARPLIDQPHQHLTQLQPSIQRGLELVASGHLRVTIRETARGVYFDLARSTPEGLARQGNHVETGGLSRGELPPVVQEALRMIDLDRPSEPPVSKGAGPAWDGESSSSSRDSHAGSATDSSTLAEATGFEDGPIYQLDSPYAHLGTGLAAGDFNGDGVADLAMGAPGAGGPGQPQRGAVYVVFGGGASVAGPQDVARVADQVLWSGVDYARFGWALAPLDFNGDGVLDLAVSAPTTNARSIGYQGAIRVFFGQAGVGLSTSPDVLIETSAQYTNLGQVLGAGDWNGDGLDDLLIGSPFSRAGGTQRGQVAVFLASSSHQSGASYDLSAADWAVSGEANYDWFGAAVTVARSNNLGRLLLVGAPTARREGRSSLGKVYGYLASALEDGQQTPYFTLLGEEEDGQLGASLLAGNLLGDGDTVVAIGAPTSGDGASRHAGRVHLLRLDDLVGESTLDQIVPLTTIVGTQANARLGWSVGSSFVDDDALPELWLSAPWRVVGGEVENGEVRLWQGGRLRADGATVLDGMADVVVEGPSLAGRLGERMVFPDLNGDGLADAVFSSRQTSEVAPTAGSVQVFFNRPGNLD